jgi:hypothetical protein
VARSSRLQSSASNAVVSTHVQGPGVGAPVESAVVGSDVEALLEPEAKVVDVAELVLLVEAAAVVPTVPSPSAGITSLDEQARVTDDEQP